MKAVYLIILAAILFSCKKERYSGNAHAEEIALVQSLVISNPVPVAVIKDTTIGGKRIFTYADNVTTLELVPTKIIGQWTATVKRKGLSFVFAYKEAAITGYKICTYLSSTGITYSSYKVSTAGQITEATFVTDFPTDLIGGRPRLVTGGCLRNAVNVCIHSKFCYVLCSTGGWGGCLLGWTIMCI